MGDARTTAAFAGAFIVAALLWFGAFFAQLGEPSSISRWNHAIFEEKQAIAQATPGPRIVIAGGSGALYGVRARDLSRELGVPVINAGLHAGLGEEYYLHQLGKLVRPGDTIVFALEYQMYMDLPDGPVLLDYMAARDPAFFASLAPARQARDILAMTFGRLVNPFLTKSHAPAVAPAPSLQSDTYLDRQGDTLGNAAVFKTDALRRSLEALHPLRIRVDAPSVRRLVAFARWARERHIGLLATHPNTIDYADYYARPEIQAQLEAVTRAHDAAGIPFVDGWRDTLFERGLFFDTIYHLDSVGATLRTHALVERLRPFVSARAWGAVAATPPSSHPLEVLDREFRFWEPLSGFGTVELAGPSQPVIAVAAPQARMVVRTLHASAARLDARLRVAHGGEVRLMQDDHEAARWQLRASAEDQPIEAELALHAGDNRFSLVGAPGAVISRWRIEPDNP